MPQPRKYQNDAEKQQAYREREAQRQEQREQYWMRKVKELEIQLRLRDEMIASLKRRAEAAEIGAGSDAFWQGRNSRR